MAVPPKPNTPVEEYLAAILAELARLNATMKILAERASPARITHPAAPSTPTKGKEK